MKIPIGDKTELVQSHITQITANVTDKRTFGK